MNKQNGVPPDNEIPSHLEKEGHSSSCCDMDEPEDAMLNEIRRTDTVGFPVLYPGSQIHGLRAGSGCRGLGRGAGCVLTETGFLSGKMKGI